MNSQRAIITTSWDDGHPLDFKLGKILKENQESKILSFIYTTNILTIVANFGLKNHLIISERNDPELQTISNIWSLLRNIFYRFADKVTANSQKACGIIRKYVSSKKVIFIPNHIFFKKKIHASAISSL